MSGQKRYVHQAVTSVNNPKLNTYLVSLSILMVRINNQSHNQVQNVLRTRFESKNLCSRRYLS